MISVKEGVRLSEAVAMALLLRVAEDVFAVYGGSITTITSGVDGVHSPGSKHYIGHALDFRTRDVVIPQDLVSASDVRSRIAAEMQRRLGPDFDVIDEGDHIHAEWDPR